MGVFLELGGRGQSGKGALAVSPCSSVASSSHSSCPHYPWPCPGVGPVQRASEGRSCALQVHEEQTGPRGSACLFLRMIEHLHPSVVNGPSSFPASLASAYSSPAVLDQPIHHIDWFPPSIFLLPLLSKLVLNFTDFSQHPE